MYVIKNTFSVTHASYRLEDNLISCPFNRVFPLRQNILLKPKQFWQMLSHLLSMHGNRIFWTTHNPWQYDYSSYILLHAQVGGMIKEANPVIHLFSNHYCARSVLRSMNWICLKCYFRMFVSLSKAKALLTFRESPKYCISQAVFPPN